MKTYIIYDAKNLVNGYFFIYNRDFTNKPVKDNELYQVLDTSELRKQIVTVKCYHTDINYTTYKVSLRSGETIRSPFTNSDLSRITIFNSKDEAIKWLEYIAKIETSKFQKLRNKFKR